MGWLLGSEQHNLRVPARRPWYEGLPKKTSISIEQPYSNICSPKSNLFQGTWSKRSDWLG